MSKKVNFESAFKRLEEIARLLESEDTSLDDSIKLYEEGMELVKVCMDKLNSAEQKITKLTENSEGDAE